MYSSHGGYPTDLGCPTDFADLHGFVLILHTDDHGGSRRSTRCVRMTTEGYPTDFTDLHG